MMSFHLGDRNDQFRSQSRVGKVKLRFAGKVGDTRNIVTVEIDEPRIETCEQSAVAGFFGDRTGVAPVPGPSPMIT